MASGPVKLRTLVGGVPADLPAVAVVGATLPLAPVTVGGEETTVQGVIDTIPTKADGVAKSELGEIARPYRDRYADTIDLNEFVNSSVPQAQRHLAITRAFTAALSQGKRLKGTGGDIAIQYPITCDFTQAKPGAVLEVDFDNNTRIIAYNTDNNWRVNALNSGPITLNNGIKGARQSVIFRGGTIDTSNFAINDRIDGGLVIQGRGFENVRVEGTKALGGAYGEQRTDSLFFFGGITNLDCYDLVGEGADDAGWYASGAYYTEDGVEVLYGQNNNLYGGTFRDCAVAVIGKRELKGMLVRGTSVYDCKTGVATGEADVLRRGAQYVDFADLYMSGVYKAVQLQHSDRGKLARLRSFDMGWGGLTLAMGVLIEGCSNCEVSDCLIVGRKSYVTDSKGIFILDKSIGGTLYTSQGNKISRTTIDGTHEGVTGGDETGIYESLTILNTLPGRDYYLGASTALRVALAQKTFQAPSVYGVGLGDRNLADNASLSVFSGATSRTGITDAGPLLADRYRITTSGTGFSLSEARQRHTPDEMVETGAFFERVTVDTAGALTDAAISQRYEDLLRFAGKTITLAWRVRLSATRNVRPYIVAFNTGTGGSEAPANISAAARSFAAGGWAWFTETIALPSLAGLTVAADSYLEVRFRIDAPTDGLQIDVDAHALYIGETDEVFIERSPAAEVARSVPLAVTVPLTRAAGLAARIPAAVTAFTTLGFAVPGDNGGASYARAASNYVTTALDFTSADGAKWQNVSPVLRPQMAGGFADGVTSVHAALQAVLDVGRPVEIPDAPAGSFYALSATVGFPSGTRIRAQGKNATFRALAGSSANPLLFGVYNTANDIVIEGLIFDGNRPNITNFNNVVTNFQCSGVTYRRCKWINTRGIAAIFQGTSDCGLDDCDVTDCGTLNRTTGVDSDRRQGVAFGGAGSDNFVRHSRLTSVGLDSIAFGGGQINPKAIDNRITDTNAAPIYNAGTVGSIISGNKILGQTSGNGIDNYGVKDATISVNEIAGCGAGGILIAGDCSDVTVTANVCKNNVKSPSTTLHKGGITFHFSAGSTMARITLSANVCTDDQGGTATTQYYAVGVVDDGGARSGILIAADNTFRGYNSSGVETDSNIFQLYTFGATFFPQTVILNDQAEYFICTGNLTRLVYIVQVNNSQYALISPRNGQSPAKLLDTGSGFTTGTGFSGVTNTAVYYDSATNSTRLRNMYGAQKVYIISLLSLR